MYPLYFTLVIYVPSDCRHEWNWIGVMTEARLSREARRGRGIGGGVIKLQCNQSYAMFVHSIWMAWVLSFLVAHQPFRGYIKSRHCEMCLVYL